MSWIERLTVGKEASAVRAKERLKLVLIHDRTDLSPETIESIKNDLLEVISRYVEIDAGEIKIRMNQEGREQRLVADIPLKSSARRRVR
ncbi:MAG: cell division topological specificity factor MinE [Anaerolineae bacterium]|nr:cell division topological specificity factor MinE [Anaerolineae bacterium]